MATVRILSDERIVELSENRVVTNTKDFNLKYGYAKPYAGSLFDASFFGSIYSEKCNCGLTRTKSRVPMCKNCNSSPLPDELQDTRIARIELANYYIPELYRKEFIKELNKFTVGKFDTNKLSVVAKRLPLFAWTINENNKLVPSLEWDDSSYLSYRGLIKCLSEAGIEHTKLRSFMLRNVVVTPLSYRKCQWTSYTGKKELVMDPINAVYKGLIALNNLVTSPTKLEDLQVTLAYLSTYATKLTSDLSKAMKSSKGNYARKMQATRVKDSGRMVLSNNPSLKVDEVGLPLSAAYEIFANYFLTYLTEYGFTKLKAHTLIKYPDESLITAFLDWVTKQVVIIGRQPTLHRGSILAMKVVINTESDFTIALNPAILEPLNADYDGDQIWFRAVRPELAEDVIRKMSPRFFTKYVKNGSLLAKLSHSQLAAAVRFSRIDFSKPTKTYSGDASEYKDLSMLDFPVSHKGVITSIRRIWLSTQLGVDIDILTEGRELNAPMVAKLLESFGTDERVEKLHQLQTILGEYLTKEGISTINYEDIYPAFLSTRTALLDFYKSDEFNTLSKELKVLRLSAMFEEMIQEYESIIKSNRSLMDSSRIKLSALSTLALPTLIINGDGTPILTDTGLIESYSEDDLHNAAVNSRAVHYVKLTSVPGSGYLFRQLTNLAANFQFSTSDEFSYAVLELDAKDAIGRTRPDMTIVGPDEVGRVEVMSIIGCQSQIIDKHLLTIDYSDADSGKGLGYDITSSFQEAITQSLLGLKHGGGAFSIDDTNLIVKERCTILSKDTYFLTVQGDSGKSYKYLIGSDLVVNDVLYPGKLNSYSRLITPDTGLRSIVAAIGATGVSSTVRDINIPSASVGDCFAMASGEIEFQVAISGNKTTRSVIIGGIVHKVKGTCLYPEGYVVSKGTKISTDNFDIAHAIKSIGYIDTYYLFLQFIRQYNNLSSVVVEFIYNLITPDNKYMRVSRALRSRSNFIEKLSYQESKRVIREELFKSSDELESDDKGAIVKAKDNSILTYLYL